MVAVFWIGHEDDSAVFEDCVMNGMMTPVPEKTASSMSLSMMSGFKHVT
jgi:hypothetical protein